jgi:hypothetical protein
MRRGDAAWIWAGLLLGCGEAPVVPVEPAPAVTTTSVTEPAASSSNNGTTSTSRAAPADAATANGVVLTPDAAATVNSPAPSAVPVDQTPPQDEFMTTPIAGLPAGVQESLDLFAYATLQLQRVKLLQERGLQKSLGLTPLQIERFSKLNEDVEQLTKTLQQLKPAEREVKLQTEYRPKASEYQTLVDQELTPAQSRLLFREVIRKQRGAITFLLPGMTEELTLTEGQRKKLYLMVEETRQAVNFDNLSSPFEIAKLISRANAARKQAEGLLDPTQTSKFAALIAK